MSTNTSIEWTRGEDGTPGATWNPVRGCTKVSAGCKHCYAERFAERFRGVKGHPFEQGFDLRLVPAALNLPLRWRRPRRVFVNSMSDLFHEAVPDSFIHRVFEVMSRPPCERHTFQILTKRAERMRRFFEGWMRPPLRNVWLGVSVEDQRAADERIPHLLATPAAVRFLSCEPLLGPVDLTRIELPASFNLTPTVPARVNCLTDQDDEHFYNDHAAIDWVIVGGESGPGARPCDLDWIRSLVKQCRAAGVPAFVKQIGARAVWGGTSISTDPAHRLTLSDRKGGDPAEWPEDLRVRQFPKEPTR